ncbi:MAG: beta-ketoacyl-ACP synthase II [Ignavibacteria bacterium]|nr:beta-ketoacyl-ACP synthase II [Ignavibacteria bacterium]
MQRRRVVVTGIGAVTPIGLNIKEFWKNLIEGKSGAAYITRFDASTYDTKFACEVKDFDPLKYFDRKNVQRLDLFSQFALVSTDEAVQNSELKLDSIDKNRVGVVFGSGIGGMWTWHHQTEVYFKGGGPQKISPFFVPMMISDIAAGHISMKYGFKGLNYATTSACATSAHAIALGAIHIQRGDADVVVVGGSEASICPMGIAGFNAMKAMSTRNDAPEKASRPFDKNRDGFVMGEGSATLILEDYEFAVKRGAPILAELVGIGLTADAYHITAPAPGGEGAVRSMRLCIEDAGIRPEDVDYINAHGTSTPYNDKNETEAIKTLFGEHAYKLVVSSTKSMTGHLLGAAGALEAVVTVLTLMNDIIPPTINYEEPDPECDLNYAPNKAIERKVNYAISNAFGFGGHNVSLLFKKYQ